VCISLRGGERSEVSEDRLGIFELKTDGAPSGEVQINGLA
jgi:hypothetical protein